ncbi:hypothetical protein NDU88_000927 [Pleurodeles waltl]|uniref:Uncharacterized protein n=1 Tax=Pleurodeles waltl TaxID=8319 RepID=A0AAV7P5J2_PLEWA|nr:hypothetical protein NDU88_000927 [Pleurodeles waltl]
MEEKDSEDEAGKNRRGGQSKRIGRRQFRESNQEQQKVLMDCSTVLNLSGVELNEQDIKILSLGLSFCDENKFDYVQAMITLFKFARKFKLAKLYEKKDGKKTQFGETERSTEQSNLLVDDVYIMKELLAREN